jgi:hypothetical protein
VDCASPLNPLQASDRPNEMRLAEAVLGIGLASQFSFFEAVWESHWPSGFPPSPSMGAPDYPESSVGSQPSALSIEGSPH